MAKFESVDDYMATLAEDRRAVMEQIRTTIREAAPKATETIAYNMPALRLDGRFLVSYEAYRRHYSLFPWSEPMVEALGDELQPYISGKGTIRFPADQPVPVELVSRIVKIRLDEVIAEG
jgi:uncharacterized protein YdhG (YjbR/CyaY superfamily)